ncbi:glycosyl hydrolase [Streptomyces sp. NBC_01619]|uniref:glycosylhydrolase-like jelly roll fold domain-containing protein n=1 Tax=Streptomyces sp. NBC_01619 TaxID=2975901 RepID=UPI00225000F8|nr:glycosylhydrolase-like jelly roll fold domain-containing protein [Streptomyces sp. NBC_01619]MCX4510796.1 glycosyl hydrolase [Streptomyces sp. NBC_01619]
MPMPLPMPESELSRRGFVAAAGVAAAAIGGVLPAGSAFAGSPAHGAGFSPAAFTDPRRDSRPTVYWYWNGPVTHELIDTQLADLRDKGMYEVVLFPYDNEDMKPVFFSQEWFDVVGHVLEEAERTGMRVWIFNDNHFPSGRAAYLVAEGGTVGARTYTPRPELRLKGLWRSTAVVEGPARIDLRETTGAGISAGRLVADAAVLAGAAVLRGGDDWTDYDVTANAKTETGSVGLVVRASASGTDGYAVEFDQTGVVTVSRLTGGSAQELARSSRTDGFNRTKFHTFAVTVRGSTLSVTLDGKDKGTVTDDAHPRGGVGVRAVDVQRSLWEDLTVTAADGNALYASAYDDPASAGDFRTRPLPGAAAAPIAATARPAGRADAAELVELTGDLAAGRSWQVPEGRWQIDLFGGAVLSDDTQGYTRAYLDLLDDEPVELLLDMVPGEYHRRFGRYFGTVVPGFWDDEPFIASAGPHPFKRLPWSPTLAAALREVGAEPGKAYASTFDDLGAAGQILRGRYWRAVSNRFSKYFEKQAHWYADRRVRLVTNPLYDETGPSKRILSTGDLHKANQWAQVPGGDVITGEYVAGEPTMDPRNAASVAHQTGRERALTEAFGNVGWQVAPEFVHALIGAFATRGTNLTVLHALWTNEAKVYFPPPFGPRAPWWWAMRPIADWIGRTMELARGTSAARTALLQPQRAAEQLTGTQRQGEVDGPFADAAYALESAQVDFDLLHEGALADDRELLLPARVHDGRLSVGRARYDLVVLPETPVLEAEAAGTLARFARAGGTVVAVGALPQREANGRDDALRRALDALFEHRRALRVSAVAELAAATREFAAARLEPAAPAVRVLRTTRGGDLAFLFNNESATPVDTWATLPTRGTPEWWDPEDGTAVPAPVYRTERGDVRVPLKLGPYRTVGVVLRHAAHPRPHLTDAGTLPVTAVTAVTARRDGLRVEAVAEAPGSWPLTGTDGRRTYRGTARVTDPLEPIPLDGDWTLTLHQEGAQPVVRPLGSWSDIARLFSGSATYTKDIELSPATLAGRRLHLDLGTVREVAEVTVNGTTLPPALWTPYVVDVTEALRPGANRIAVRVSNTLSNERNKPLPSGLLGPVVLRPRRPLTTDLH